jgi:hypothetical protein
VAVVVVQVGGGAEFELARTLQALGRGDGAGNFFQAIHTIGIACQGPDAALAFER